MSPSFLIKEELITLVNVPLPKKASIVSFNSIPSTVKVPVIFALPKTFNKFIGVVVPIPTLFVLLATNKVVSSKVEFPPVTFKLPQIVNLSAGFIVPIPILSLKESTNNVVESKV